MRERSFNVRRHHTWFEVIEGAEELRRGSRSIRRTGAAGQTRGKRAQWDQMWYMRKHEPAMFSDALPDDLGLLQFVLRGHGHGRLIIILARSPWYLVIFPAGGEGTAWWLVSRTLFSSHIDGDKADGRPACHLL